MSEVIGVVLVAVVAILATAIGLRFGIVVLAPRITRAVNSREDEESRDGSD